MFCFCGCQSVLKVEVVEVGLQAVQTVLEPVVDFVERLLNFGVQAKAVYFLLDLGCHELLYFLRIRLLSQQVAEHYNYD